MNFRWLPTRWSSFQPSTRQSPRRLVQGVGTAVLILERHCAEFVDRRRAFVRRQRGRGAAGHGSVPPGESYKKAVSLPSPSQVTVTRLAAGTNTVPEPLV